jgi:hypothetical protein
MPVCRSCGGCEPHVVWNAGGGRSQARVSRWSRCLMVSGIETVGIRSPDSRKVLRLRHLDGSERQVSSARAPPCSKLHGRALIIVAVNPWFSFEMTQDSLRCCISANAEGVTTRPHRLVEYWGSALETNLNVGRAETRWRKDKRLAERGAAMGAGCRLGAGVNGCITLVSW